jgi:hypothetical protein
MKIEHRSIVERAKRDGLFPAEIASELLEHDLVQLCLDQLRGQTVTYGKLSQHAQQDTIERITLGVKDAAKMAIRIIAANGVATIPVDVKRVQVDEKKLTVTVTVDGKDPKKHDLVDSAGRLCLLVMAPDDYNEGLDGIQPERDQKELALSASEIAGGMGLVPSNDDQPGNDSPSMLDDLNSITDTTYEEVLRLVVEAGGIISVTWMQQNLAVTSEKATSLLLQLIADNVIEVDTEADQSIDYTYKVTNTQPLIVE